MRTTFAIAKILSLLVFVSLAASCAGVKVSMKAERIDAPVSFTPCVYGATGNVIRASEQDTLKHFKIKKRFWAMLWRNINLTQNDWDLSEDLSREVSSVNGDAIVNMTVLSQGGWWWYFSSLLPIIPDYHTILVEGDVVRLTPEAKSR